MFLEQARREGGGRLPTLWEWTRGFSGRWFEALLGMEVAVLQGREPAAGISNWHSGDRSNSAANCCRFTSDAPGSLRSWPRRCF